MPADKTVQSELDKVRKELCETRAELEGHEGLLNLAIEDMRKIYHDLLETQARLFQADKLSAIGLMAAGIIHEVGNPLTSASAQLEFLKEEMSESFPGALEKPALREALETSQKALDAMTGIVKSLKGFVRPDEGVMAPADIHSVINGVIDLLAGQAKNRIEFQREFGPLPPVICNDRQLAQVFMNLFLNAIQAIEKKGMVTVKTAERDGRVQIDVSDTGAGMTEEVRSRIFTPFFTTKKEGTGLGLGVVRDIVVGKHEGEISLKSEPGKGTTFTILLPVRRNP